MQALNLTGGSPGIEVLTGSDGICVLTMTMGQVDQLTTLAGGYTADDMAEARGEGEQAMRDRVQPLVDEAITAMRTLADAADALQAKVDDL